MNSETCIHRQVSDAFHAYMKHQNPEDIDRLISKLEVYRYLLEKNQ